MLKKAQDKLNAIYQYIIDFTEENGYSPTIREIGSHFKISSTSNVFYYLEKLKKEGRISRDHFKNRAITTQKSSVKSNFVATPLVGNVSAGQGIFAEQNIEGYYSLPRELYDKEDQFLLKVEGDSMKDIGICNSDFVVVAKQSNADIDDIVVVYWQEKATVKRLKAFEPLTLHPENSTMQDIIIPYEDNPIILGKVIGCLKKF